MRKIMEKTMTINKLITQQHRAGEETEFYPTPDYVVERIAKYLSEKSSKNIYSVLDIGCGNGSFFSKLDSTECFNSSNNYESKLMKSYTKYGIEKSNILAEQLPEDVVLLGSDFHNNTLIDKKIDVIFCNPPYSEYEEWSDKIILEGNANTIVLVIPSRWINSEKIKTALKKRKFSFEIIEDFDFYEAERKARAKASVVVIRPETTYYNGRSYDATPTDPFDVWFESTFKFNAEKDKENYYENKSKERENEIIEKGDTAEMLVKFYNDEMNKLYENYRSLEKLDSEIFSELKVDVEMLKESLKMRLKGLKHIYWDMLFKKYNKLTCRLTTEGKRKVTQKLKDNTAIDFTLENIYQLTLWIIRNSNTLIDQQLTEFFFELCNSENIHRYKSNLRWNDDEWRYLKDSCTDYGTFRKDKAKKILKNIQLDYRIIVSDHYNFDIGYRGAYRMAGRCREFLYDLTVIADNLGFKTTLRIPDEYEDLNLSDWNNFNIYTSDGNLFCNVKLYKNGNRHLKFNPAFMQKLNVEMARINGWIQDKSEAAKEFCMSPAEIERIWKSNIKIGINDGSRLLGLPVA